MARYVVTAPTFLGDKYLAPAPGVPMIITYNGAPSRTWRPIDASAQAALAKLGVSSPIVAPPSPCEIVPAFADTAVQRDPKTRAAGKR